MDIRALSEIGVRLVLGSLGLTVFGIFFGLVYKGIDRKLSAHMQGRIGPPLRQPFRDFVKLFAKENIVPDHAIPWVFNFVPLVGLIVTTSILVYLPLGGFPPLFSMGGDLIVVLYLLMIPSLCLVIGGFSSGSPYAIVGAQREMAVMIAYEFPLAILIVTIAWKLLQKGVTEVFSFSTIVSMPVWNQVSGPLGLIGFAILLVVLLLVTPAEMSKVPFDAAEAETEIAGGLLVEYSGRNLAMFYLTDGVKTVVFASLIVAVFFPYGLSNVLGLSSYVGMLVDMVFFLFKVFLVVLFSVTLIRVAIARLKIDQIVYTYWIPLTLASLVGLILVMWDSVIMSFLTNT
jgi:NADH-quinone oxidoreductase subunit H